MGFGALRSTHLLAQRARDGVLGFAFARRRVPPSEISLRRAFLRGDIVDAAAGREAGRLAQAFSCARQSGAPLGASAHSVCPDTKRDVPSRPATASAAPFAASFAMFDAASAADLVVSVACPPTAPSVDFKPLFVCPSPCSRWSPMHRTSVRACRTSRACAHWAPRVVVVPGRGLAGRPNWAASLQSGALPPPGQAVAAAPAQRP